MRSTVAGPAPPLEAPPDGSILLQPLAPVRRDIFTRSYRLGETYTVHTGEQVVIVKNYAITEKVGRARTCVLVPYAFEGISTWLQRLDRFAQVVERTKGAR